MAIAFILIIIVLRINKYESKINSICSAIIIWNVFSLAIVELLSEIHMLTKNGLIFAWGIVDVMLIGMIGAFRIRKRNKIAQIDFIRCLKGSKQIFVDNKLIVLVGLIVLFLAFVTVPYNWDSMTYHLPRIAHWAQNQSVAHFATNDVRQLSSPVLAEFINVQVYILCGKRDNLLNLLQAFSYLVNAWLVYEIAIKIGCRKKFAALATLLFMTMPIAFAEALTTQVDLVASVWLLLFVYYFIDLYEATEIIANEKILKICVKMGFCVSFGYLAKPSVNIGMVILAFFLLFKCIRRKDRVVELIKLIIGILPTVVLPLIPELCRNYHTFKALSDPVTGARQLIGTLRPNYLLVNLIKNFAQNWSNIYLYDSNEWMTKIVMLIAAILKVDINDVRIAEDGMTYIMQEAPTYSHDTAVNPVVMILSMIFFVWCLFRIRNHREIGNKYSVWAMSLFIIFCGLVRWESFVTRYMLSYLAMLCPMIGWQIQTFTQESKREELRTVVVPIVYFLCLTELFSLCRYHQEQWHENASVRPEDYFSQNKGIREEYLDTLSWVKEKGYQRIGIKLSGFNYEYPIWHILDNPEIQMEHVLVENASIMYADTEYVPDCILGDVNLGDSSDAIVFNGILYQKAEQFDENKYMVVYLPKALDINEG